MPSKVGLRLVTKEGDCQMRSVTPTHPAKRGLTDGVRLVMSTMTLLASVLRASKAIASVTHTCTPNAAMTCPHVQFTPSQTNTKCLLRDKP